jgi:hypothetical protein
MLVYHPLSGRVDASAFHLDAGRLCVALSRHRVVCFVFARAGIASQPCAAGLNVLCKGPFGVAPVPLLDLRHSNGDALKSATTPQVGYPGLSHDFLR